METFDEWITLHYPMFELTGDREEDTTARLVRAVALDLFNSRMELYEALQNIAEYWNQDQNPGAMVDACWHAIETAQAALAKARGE